MDPGLNYHVRGIEKNNREHLEFQIVPRLKMHECVGMWRLVSSLDPSCSTSLDLFY